MFDSKIVKIINYSFESYKREYPEYDSELKKIGIHNPDDKIILDCYYFRKTEFDEDVAFITKDNFILDSNSKIESLLDGVHIHTV